MTKAVAHAAAMEIPGSSASCCEERQRCPITIAEGRITTSRPRTRACGGLLLRMWKGQDLERLSEGPPEFDCYQEFASPHADGPRHRHTRKRHNMRCRTRGNG